MLRASAKYGPINPIRTLQQGSSLSLLGSRVATIAYPMLVLLLTHSPFDAGLMGFAVIVPAIFVYLPAGALVDRWPPRRAMMISEFFRGIAIMAVILVILVHGAGCFPWIIVPAVIEEALGAFSVLAEQCYLRQLVRGDVPGTALATREANNHLAVVLGRPLGGVLFGMNPVLPFIFDYLTFVVSVTLLIHLRCQETRQCLVSVICRVKFFRPRGQLRELTSGDRRSGDRWRLLAADTMAGISWIRKDKFARVAIPASAGSSIVAQALIIVFLALATRQHLPQPLVGVSLGASGLGGVCGAKLESGIRFHPSWIFSMMWVGTVVLMITAMLGARSPTVFILAMAVFGLTGAMGNIELSTYLMSSTEEAILGRVLSVRQLCAIAASAVGPLLGGVLADYDLSRAVLFLFWLTLGFAFSTSAALMRSYQRWPTDPGNFWRAPVLEPVADWHRKLMRDSRQWQHQL